MSQSLIAIAGDPLGNRSCMYRQNLKEGYVTMKRVRWAANGTEPGQGAALPR